jgi:hypothetical protein
MAQKEIKTYKFGKYKDLKKYDASDFDLLDDLGLELLVNLIGADGNDHWHMRFLHETWKEYLEVMELKRREFIKSQPYYANFLSIIEKLNSTRPEKYTKEDIIRDHVDKNTPLYEEYYNKRSWDDTRVTNLPPGLVGYTYKQNMLRKEAATNILLNDLNKGRGELKPIGLDFYLYKEAVEWDPDSVLLHHLFDEHVKPYVPTIEDFSVASEINEFGNKITNFRKKGSGSSPLRWKTSDFADEGEYESIVCSSIDTRWQDFVGNAYTREIKFQDNEDRLLMYLCDVVMRISKYDARQNKKR